MPNFTSHLPAVCVLVLCRHQAWMSLGHKSLRVSILSSLFIHRVCGGPKPEPRSPGCFSNPWTMLPPMALSFCWPGMFILLPGVGVFLKKSIQSHDLFDMPQWVLLTLETEKCPILFLLMFPAGNCTQIYPCTSAEYQRDAQGRRWLVPPQPEAHGIERFSWGKLQQRWVLFLYPEL